MLEVMGKDKQRERKKIAIVIHAYYLEQFNVILDKLHAIFATPQIFACYQIDIHITVPKHLFEEIHAVTQQNFNQATIHAVENYGMDLLPFFALIPSLQSYDWVLKLHTKNADNAINQKWFNIIIDSLIGTPEIFIATLALLEKQPTWGMAGLMPFFLSSERLKKSNQDNVVQLAQLWNIDFSQEWGFFAGSFYWVKPQALLNSATTLLRHKDWFKEEFSHDGQMAHAVERLIAKVVEQTSDIGLLFIDLINSEPKKIEFFINQKHPFATNQAFSHQLIESFINISETVQILSKVNLLDIKRYSELSQLDFPTQTVAYEHYSLIGQFSKLSKLVLPINLKRQQEKLFDWRKLKEKLRNKDIVSIIIPVFNEIKLTLKCLEAIRKNTYGYNYEIIIVDNGSNFLTQKALVAYAKLHRNCKVLRLPKNLNFSVGCNYGFSQSLGEYVVFLNNDTEVTNGWLSPLIVSLQQPNISMVQPLLLYPDDTVQCAGIEFGEDGFGYTKFEGRLKSDIEVQISQACPALTAACMVIRAEDFISVKGFDTWYINGQEDIDLCLRLKNQNPSTILWYCAESVVYHIVSQSKGRSTYITQNRMILMSRQNLKLNVLKNNELLKEYSIMNHSSNLKLGNDYFKNEQYYLALGAYKQALFTTPSSVLLKQIHNNIKLTEQRISKNSQYLDYYYEDLGIDKTLLLADVNALEQPNNVIKINKDIWQATTDDPSFEVDLKPFTLNSTSTIKFVLNIIFNHSQQNVAKIYIDYGQGYSENNSHIINLVSGIRKETLIELTSTPKDIWFDPIGTQDEFIIIDFYVLNYDYSNHAIKNIQQERQIEVIKSKDLICQNNITQISDNKYISLNNDPHFIIEPNKLKNMDEGFYLVELNIELEQEGGNVAKFYIDYGQGISEKNIFVIPYYSHIPMYKIVKFTNSPVGLRFDPSEIEGNIIFHNFTVTRILEPNIISYFANYLTKVGKEYKSKSAKSIHEYQDYLFKLYESSFNDQINSFFAKNMYNYTFWLNEIESKYLEKKYQLKADFLDYKPILSYFIILNNDTSFDELSLEKLISSFKNQYYTHWLLYLISDNHQTIINKINSTILDDKRILTLVTPNSIENNWKTIVKNTITQTTTSNSMGIIDRPGVLSPYALLSFAKMLNENPAIQFLYTDEDTLNADNRRINPEFKPDWNIDWFLSTNYIKNLWVLNILEYRKVGGFENTAGISEHSAIYELLLKSIIRLDNSQIKHIAEVHFHNYEISDSLSEAETLTNRRSVQAVIADKFHKQVTVKQGLLPNINKIEWTIPNALPKVSIIMPTKDKKDFTEVAVKSVLEKTTYTNYELIIVDNQSSEPEILKFFKDIQQDKRVKVLKYDYPFNYSAINNFAVKKATGELICLLNNDVEVISPDWLTEMVSHAVREDIGCVGAKLYYANDTIQHAGVVMGVGGVAAHGHRLSYKTDNGYLNQLKLVRDCTAVTAACLVVKKSIYTEVGGLDEENFKVAYNDVDFCLKVFHKGYRNLWTPYAELYHYESLTRGSDADNKIKLERLLNESAVMMDKWGEFLEHDPNYNMNLSVSNDQFGVADNVEFPIHYEGNIFYEWYARPLIDKKHACVFVNFDAKSELHDYVVNYLEALAKYYDIYFVSTSDKLHENPKAIKQLKKYCKYIAVRKNEGYDFGSWRLGIEKLEPNLSKYATLLLCNDSIYGPFFDLKDVINRFFNSDLDVMGLTESNEIKYHLQSFFVMYKPEVFLSDFFRDFWHNIKMQKQKWSIITKYEIGLSQKLIRSKNAQFKIGPYCDTTGYPVVNLTHVYWRDLIEKHKFPFIKVELLRDNPRNQDISDWRNVIKKNTNYDVTLIEKHLKKIAKPRD